MARKKLNLQRIGNDATRRATFKKRRNGLMKKARELSTLCGVDACLVVYGEGASQPEVWPSAPEAARVVARFKAMPELDQCKKMMDMNGILKQRNDKAKEQLNKAKRENRERETKLHLQQAINRRCASIVGLTAEELASLGWLVENLIRKVKGDVGHPQEQGQGVPATAALQQQLPQAQAPLPPLVPYTIDAGRTEVPMSQPQGWPMDMSSMAGGELGAMFYGGFFGCGLVGSFNGDGAGTSAGASASAGAGAGTGADVLPLPGNVGAGFAWPDAAGPSFPSM
ncbi:hypothetical protein ACP70R_005184 [Stipagrostis hirtigluma subsp. patula]